MASTYIEPPAVVDNTRRMVGITTKYSGPGYSRGSRIIARWADAYEGRPTVGPASIQPSYRPELNEGENHLAAAQELLAKSGRDPHWQIVGRIDSHANGYTFVLDYVR